MHFRETHRRDSIFENDQIIVRKEYAVEKWVEIRKGGNFTQLGEELHVSPVIARLMANRGVAPEQMHMYLYGTTADMYDPLLLKDAKKAAAIMLDALKAGERIRIIGDYDVDGVCSSAIIESSLIDCMQIVHGRADRGQVDTRLPNRITDGYGLNIRLIDEAYSDGVRLIVTTDNGIAAAREIEHAKSLGIKVVVTDHHEVPYEDDNGERRYLIPAADAVVNPKQEDCGYPFKMLCGGAVAYKISQILFDMVGLCDKEKYLDLAAVATIADVMPLSGENRIIVKEGLKKLAHTENLGMRTLIAACGLEGKIGVYHVGFVIGPTINATGRLDSAQRAQELLMCTDRIRASEIASELVSYNEQRKGMTEAGVNRGIAILESRERLDDVIVLYLPDCHESLAGIIAGKIRERFNHPAIVITSSADGVKGSGRSIEQYDMFEKLNEVRDLFSKFGGHKMAAGLSMSADTDEERERKVCELSERLNAASGLTEDDFCARVEIDMALPFSFVSEELIQQLECIAPCGMGNRTPLFAAKNVRVTNGRVLGKSRNTFKAVAEDDSGIKFDMLMFGDGDSLMQELNGRNDVLITFYPDINVYAGRRTIQLMVKNYR